MHDLLNLREHKHTHTTDLIITEFRYSCIIYIFLNKDQYRIKIFHLLVYLNINTVDV